MLSIQSKGFTLTPALKGRVQRRIGLILGAADPHITKVDVRLSDINGPRGGVDKKCQIHIHLKNRTDIIISDIQHDMYYAIDRAASRALRTMRRRLSQRDVEHDRRTLDARAAVEMASM